MKSLRIPALLLFSATFVGFSPSAIAAKSVPLEIQDGDVVLKGTLVLPARQKGASKALPLVLVIPEWWGKTDYPMMRANRIAEELGYAALAVDLFGGGRTAATPQQAQELTAPFYKDAALGMRRLDAFIQAAPRTSLAAGVTLDPAKVAAIGYCFGGAQALNLARSGAKLAGVVSFHGSLASSLKAKAPLETPILVLHGAADKMVGPEAVSAFKAEMAKARASLEFHAYPGALHAFTNPAATENGRKFNIPIAYDEKADRDSWNRMKDFLGRNFSR